MHALRRFIEDGLNERVWTQSDLVRESGITKQVVSGLLNDTRDKLDRLPQDKTVDGLARAFGVNRAVVLSVIGQSMGLPMHEPVTVYDASGVSNDDLLRVLADRLRAPAADAVDPRDYAWAARDGEPDAGPDTVTGEESQTVGGSTLD